MSRQLRTPRSLTSPRTVHGHLGVPADCQSFGARAGQMVAGGSGSWADASSSWDEPELGDDSAHTGCSSISPMTDASIFAAVAECRAESSTFDCPASQATYGPIEDWDVSAVTSFNNWGSGCSEEYPESYCGEPQLASFEARCGCAPRTPAHWHMMTASALSARCHQCSLGVQTSIGTFLAGT